MVDFYGTAAGFRIYHIARGRNVDAFDDDDEVNAALLVGSERNDRTYGGSFGGLKVGFRAQEREFPRTGGFDRDGYVIASDTIPTEMINATYEAALRQLVEPGSLSIDYKPPKYKRASVDGAVSVEYFIFNGAMDAQTQFLIIDQIIAPILTGCGANLSPLSGETSRT